MDSFLTYTFAMTQRQLYLAAYDIASNRRLRKALYVLRGYASGGQKSVFECYLTESEKLSLLRSINQTIDLNEDRFILLKLIGVNHIEVLGKAVLPQNEFFYYAG